MYQFKTTHTMLNALARVDKSIEARQHEIEILEKRISASLLYDGHYEGMVRSMSAIRAMLAELYVSREAVLCQCTPDELTAYNAKKGIFGYETH